jgi:hypothetical protein
MYSPLSVLSRWSRRLRPALPMSSIGTKYSLQSALAATCQVSQTLLLGALLAAVSLWQLWLKHDVDSAVVTSSLYWIAQLGSLAFPGAALMDPEFRERAGARAVMQPLLASILLASLADSLAHGQVALGSNHSSGLGRSRRR